ncbi:patellin-2-like [Miscanthus floridulus]|uniref:patellin-2-like n=1 Tax=Miscanthus floridulus TaxID=154761 RepID=UPI00345A2253
MPKAWALGKCAVSLVDSAAVVEQVAAEVTQLPPQRTEGAPRSVEDQPAPMDTKAMPLPPPPPLRTRVAVAKRLLPRSSRKRHAEVPTLAPLKALKVNPSSTAHWVAEAQAALQRGTSSARANPKEPATQGGAAEAALTQEGEGAPPPRDGEARGSDAAKVPLATETTGTEVPGVSQAGATEAVAPRTIEAAAAGTGVLATAEATMAEAGAPETTEATMAEAGAPGTTEAMMAEAGAPGTTDADMIVAGLPAQEVEMKAAEALAAPLVQELGSEASRVAEASWVEAQCLKEKAKAFRVEARHWELRAKESEAEVTRAAEAFVMVQTVLETKIKEHNALKGAARAAYEALVVEGVQSGSSLGSRLIALSGQVRERLRGALHTGVKRALAVIASHYVGVDLQAISDGYVLPDDDDDVDEVVTKLLEAAEGPGTALATLFEEEVVPPPPSADAGGPEP